MRLPRARPLPASRSLDRLLALLVSILIPAGIWLEAVPARADDDSEPPPTLGVFTSRISAPGGRTVAVTETVLPGLALAVAPWPASKGGGLAVLLVPSSAEGDDEGVAEEDDDRDPRKLLERPRALYHLRGVAGDLAPVALGLPSELESLALDPSGAELWLGEEGAIHRLSARSESGLETVLEQPGLDLGAIRGAGLLGVDDRGRSWLATPGVGRLRLWNVGEAGLELRRELSLPVTVSRRARGLALRSLPVSAFSRNDGAPLFVAGPDVANHHRSRHLLIDPSRPPAESEGDGAETGVDGGAEDWQETWTRTDRPEDLDSVSYVFVDGRPTLVAATTRADKLGIFEKFEVRVFRLAADRTRAGRKPYLAVATDTRNWYHVEPVVLDYDADGNDDLALVQPEGLGAGKTRVELYRGLGSRFERKPRRTKLDIEPSAWHFGRDLDGDGTADLLLLSGKLHVFRGIPEHRRKLLDENPWLELDAGRLASAGVEVEVSLGPSEEKVKERGSLRGSLEVLELDGDPGVELVIRRRVEGRAVIRVVEFGS